MKLIQQFVTNNQMYIHHTQIPVRKLVLHSVGCPQSNAAVFARQWQSAKYFAHAVLQADGTVYQVLPWNYLCYHVGAANAYSIGVEMTEPDCIRYTSGATFVCSNWDRAASQIRGTYNTAVELFAELCKQFGLNPYNDIISHNEASKMGIGTDHVDPEHLWKQLGLGYTMDGFRSDVAVAMSANDSNDEEEEDVVRYKNIDEVPKWYRSEIQQLIDAGALQGDSNGDLNISEDVVRGAIIGMRYVEAKNPHYHSVEDMPKYYREEAQELIDRGALLGDGKGDLNISEDSLRSMIVCQRMIDEIKEWGELNGKKKQD